MRSWVAAQVAIGFGAKNGDAGEGFDVVLDVEHFRFSFWCLSGASTLTH